VAQNLLLFGNDILFEGHRPRPAEGFDLTIVFTDSDYINMRIGIFEDLFEKYEENTVKNYGSIGKKKPENEEHLRKAVINAINKAIE
jgi:hypothetical protein